MRIIGALGVKGVFACAPLVALHAERNEFASVAYALSLTTKSSDSSNGFDENLGRYECHGRHGRHGRMGVMPVMSVIGAMSDMGVMIPMGVMVSFA